MKRLLVPLVAACVLLSGCSDLLGGGSESSGRLARIVEADLDESAFETLDGSDSPQDAFAELLDVSFEYTHDGATADADSLIAVFEDADGERQETPLSEFTRRGEVGDGDIVTITDVALTTDISIETEGGTVLAERAGLDVDWLRAEGAPLPIASSEDGAVEFEFTAEAGTEASISDMSYEDSYEDCWTDYDAEQGMWTETCETRTESWAIHSASGHVSLDASGGLRISTSAGPDGTQLGFDFSGEASYGTGFEVQGQEDGEAIDMSADMTLTASGELELDLDFDEDRNLERVTAEGRGEADLDVESDGVPGMDDLDDEFPIEESFGPEAEEFDASSSEVERSLVRFLEALWGLDLQPGDEYRLEVDLDDGTMELDASFVSQVVGREPRSVDGSDRDTLRVEDRLELQGSLEGSPFEDLAIATTYWLDEDGYLPVFAQTTFSRSYSRGELVDAIQPWLDFADASEALPEDASLTFDGTATLRMTGHSGDLRVAGITALNAVRYSTMMAPAAFYFGYGDPFGDDDYGVYPIEDDGYCRPGQYGCEPWEDDWEDEPYPPYPPREPTRPENETPIQAGPNGPFDVPEDGELWMEFYLPPAGGEVTLETSGPSSQDTVLTLYDSEVALLYSDDDGAGDGYSLIEAPLPPGFYYVALQGYGGQALDDVTVTLAIEDRADIEATPLVLGSTTGPYSVEPGEELWFAFDVATPQSVTIRTSGTSGADTVLKLYDEAFEHLSEDDDGGEGTYSLIEESLEPGHYFIELQGFDGEPFADVYLELA